jgi:hypothetical protein
VADADFSMRGYRIHDLGPPEKPEDAIRLKELDSHNTITGVHGVGNWYIAKTSRMDQRLPFTDLVDVPSSYAGAGGKFVIVKPTEDGLAFADPAVDVTDRANRVLGQITDGVNPVHPADFGSNPHRRNIVAWGGTTLTGRDITLDLAQLSKLLFTTAGNLQVALQEDAVGVAKSSQLPSSLTTAGNLKTAIQEDAVGLAKSSQLPSSLTTAGNLKVAVQEDGVGLAKSSQLPSSLTTAGNLKVAVQEDGVGLAKSSQLPSSLTAAGNLKIAVSEDAVGLAKSTDISSTQPRNIAQWGGTALTGRDVTGDLAKLQNLDVLLSSRAADATFTGAVTASGSVNAASNTAGLSVSINNDFRDLCHFRVTLGGAGDIYVESSPDGTSWYTMWTKSLTAAGTFCDWEIVGFPYFRIRVPTTAIDIAINIRAIKL